MSSVAEMSCLVHEAADFTAPTRKWKDRVHAAARALGFEWERTKAFYYQTARRVDAQEMDVARRKVRELREAAERDEIANHLDWLGRTLAHLKASDPDFYGPEIAALERTLRQVGAPDRAVAVPQSR